MSKELRAEALTVLRERPGLVEAASSIVLRLVTALASAEAEELRFRAVIAEAEKWNDGDLPTLESILAKAAQTDKVIGMPTRDSDKCPDEAYS